MNSNRPSHLPNLTLNDENLETLPLSCLSICSANVQVVCLPLMNCYLTAAALQPFLHRKVNALLRSCNPACESA